MKAFTLKNAVAPLLTLVLFSALLLLLYHFDNKYTSPAIQAADGLLVLSDDDLRDKPIRYLTHGWAFYPNALLSPNELSDKHERYMVYTMIGERSRLNFGNSTPHGSATYVMDLQLPHEPRTYALELPEIFSAYHLYINGKRVLTLGNPEPNHYTARTGSRVVTFEASARTVMTLAVSDYSHFYSGLVYPPAFGTPEAVSTARDLRLWLRVMALSATALAGLCALYLGLRLN